MAETPERDSPNSCCTSFISEVIADDPDQLAARRVASAHPTDLVVISALYGPMIEAIQHEGSKHPYVSAVCKDGRGRMTVQTARNDVKALLSLCERFAVDQEFVSADDIARLAGKPLGRDG